MYIKDNKTFGIHLITKMSKTAITVGRKDVQKNTSLKKVGFGDSMGCLGQ